MEWLEVVIGTVSGGVEALTGMLLGAGVEGIQIEDDYEMMLFLENNRLHWDYADESLMNKEKGAANVKFYVTADANGSKVLESVRSGLEELRQSGMELGALSLAVTGVDDKDWEDSWKKHYKPFTLGERVVVKPVWESYEPSEGQVVFNANPGHVFGTGLHQSTQLCVEQLEKYVKGGETVLDLGCGSGILSIIALLLGADSALAVDLDPSAVDIAYENARNNGIEGDKYRVLSGNAVNDERLIEHISEKKYGIIAANIIADVIIRLAGIVPRFTEPGGVFISSGIIRERAGEVAEALENNGFRIEGKTCMDEWVCLTAVKL